MHGPNLALTLDDMKPNRRPTFLCPAHGSGFELKQKYQVWVCPYCVAEARAKVQLAKAYFARRDRRQSPFTSLEIPK
jgi:hypothetical protein